MNKPFEPANTELYQCRLQQEIIRLLRKHVVRELKRVGALHISKESDWRTSHKLHEDLDYVSLHHLLESRDKLWTYVQCTFDIGLFPNLGKFVNSVVQDLYKRRHYLDVKFQSPPSKKPSAQARKSDPTRGMTLVESRAHSASKKLREWKRKQKLAVTKVKYYQGKTKYYNRTLNIKQRGVTT